MVQDRDGLVNTCTCHIVVSLGGYNATFDLVSLLYISMDSPLK